MLSRGNVSPDLFEFWATPIGVLLVLFTGIGPLFAWGRISGAALKRVLATPAIVAGGLSDTFLTRTSTPDVGPPVMTGTPSGFCQRFAPRSSANSASRPKASGR